MDVPEADPYKQQLYSLFKNFDTSNVGSLNKKELQQLCEQLPLDTNQSSELMHTLLRGVHDLITFSQFWECLLTVLGGGVGSAGAFQGPTSTDVVDTAVTLNREKSPEREVLPKLVLGQKKYGRRSRPESSELEFDPLINDPEQKIEVIDCRERAISSEDSNDDDEDEEGCSAKKKRIDCNQDFRGSPLNSFNASITQGNLSQAEDCLKEAWQRYGKNGFVNQSELRQVCECIGIEKLSNAAIQHLFEQLDGDRDGKVSLDDFLTLFHSGVPFVSMTPLGAQNSWDAGSNICGGSTLILTELNGVGMATWDAIVEVWENVGITNAAILLRDLNMDESMGSLNVSSLASIIEEEVARHSKNVTDDDNPAAHTPESTVYMNSLLLAALTLRQAEVKWMKANLEQMSCERMKLRNDLAEANYRATLLAQEIDDHHSKLEKVNQNQFKLLEQKHSEAIRDLTARFSQEREQIMLQNNYLEQKIATLQQSESKLITENSSLRLENESLDQESRNLTERIVEYEEAKLQMSKDLEEMESLQQRLNELQANQDQNPIEHLYDQISKLRSENSNLRDRNDELSVELEMVTTRLSSMRVRRCVPCADGGLKRRGHSPLDVAPTDESGDDESPRIGKVRRCSQKVEVSLETVCMEGLKIHPLGTSESGIEADGDVDSSENVSGSSTAKLTNDKVLNDGGQWLNAASGSCSSVGSQDDLINLPNCDIQTSVQRDIRVMAHLQARIEELERALLQYTCNVTGGHNSEDVGLHDLKDIEEVSYAIEGDASLKSFMLYPQDKHESAPPSDSKDVEQLQQHCRDLESQLDNVKVQIMKILSEKRACSVENCYLKKRISELHNQLPDCGKDSGKDNPQLVSCISFADAVCEKLQETEKPSGFCEEHSKVDKGVCTMDECGDLSSRDDHQAISVELSDAKKEVAALRDQCSDLEKSLSMMRDEYERCEDYWAGKLDEERQLAEQEQRITDEKFSELMSKIREYEDLLTDDHMRRLSKPMDGRLETIEEQDGLERQVMELEEELEHYRSLAETQLAQKDCEIQALRENIHQGLQNHGPHNVCRSDIAVQVSDLETRSWGSDHTFIVRPCVGLNEQNRFTAHVLDQSTSSSPCTSSSESLSPASHSGEDERGVSSGAIRHHKPHCRHKRIRHHLHYNTPNCLNHEDELRAMDLQLREQEQMCMRLQRALQAQKHQTQALLQHAWDRHKQEVADLQIVLQCSQEKMEQQEEICRDQTNRLTQSDILVKELYVENAHLLSSIQNLEEQCLLLLQKHVSITNGDNCSSV